MVDLKETYYSWKEIIEDLQAKGVEYIGWQNGGAEPNRIKKDSIIDIRHQPFSNTSVYYYPLANQVMCVDMS